MVFKHFRGDDVVVIERFSLDGEKMFSLRNGPLEITGGGVTIPPKTIPARETCLKEKSCER